MLNIAALMHFHAFSVNNFHKELKHIYIINQHVMKTNCDRVK